PRIFGGGGQGVETVQVSCGSAPAVKTRLNPETHPNSSPHWTKSQNIVYFLSEVTLEIQQVGGKGGKYFIGQEADS
ncbi:MAG: hypothetical protein U9R05_10220, partial [Chloroflexota bacterium]|nr:hypothetical protein [Chloroflexota bacterium]